jgi:hypothetical protein
MPAGVPASAVSEAGDVADEDLVRAEWVSVGTMCRRAGDPLPGRGLYQLAQHDYKPKANTSREPKIGLLLAHPVSQGALVTIWLLCALSVTEPPHRAVMRLALPYLFVVAVLLSLAVTELKPPAAAAA